MIENLVVVLPQTKQPAPSQEQSPLEGTGWALDFTAEGWGYLTKQGSESLWVSGLLKSNCYTTENGKVYVQTGEGVKWLDDLEKEWQGTSIPFLQRRLGLVVYTMPIKQCRVFVHARGLQESCTT